MFDRNGHRKYLNGNERSALLAVISEEVDSKRRAFLLTLFYTGCRISEGLNLQAGRVDSVGKAVVFETLKRRKPGCFRSVPVPDPLAYLLGELVAGELPEARVWRFSRPTAYRMIKSKMGQAKIIGGMACPKGLRHGYAVACVSKEIPVTKIKKWLGHARLETTAIYLDLDGEEERNLAKRIW